MRQITETFGKRLEEKGVTRKQWIVLYYLGKNDLLNQKELGLLMGIKDSTVVRLIDRMERDQLVVRKKDEIDRRVTLLSLSEKGLTVHEALLPEGQIFSDLIMAGISEADIDVFNKVMDKMLDNTKDIV